MLFVLLSKRFLHMTVLDGFAFVAIHANLLDRYKRAMRPVAEWRYQLANRQGDIPDPRAARPVAEWR